MEFLKFIALTSLVFFVLYQAERGLWYQVCLLKSIPHKDKICAEEILSSGHNPFWTPIKVLPATLLAMLASMIALQNVGQFRGLLIALAIVSLLMYLFSAFYNSLKSFNKYLDQNNVRFPEEISK